MIPYATMALIELALETGTPPKKFGHGLMYERETGEVCFFGFIGSMHGVKLDGNEDSSRIAELLELPHNKLIKYAMQTDVYIRSCGGDSREAIPMIMDYLRHIPKERTLEPVIDEPAF